MNPTRILIATGLGSASAEAQRHAARLADKTGASLALIHAVPTSGREQRKADWQESLLQVIRRQFVEATGGHQPPERIFVDEGSTDVVILSRAETWAADLLVVGGHRHAAGAGFLAGIAERIIRGATCPVLVARPGAGTNLVICGTDLTDPTLPAVHAADLEAQRRGGILLLVHCVEPPLIYGDCALIGPPMGPPLLPLDQHADAAIWARMNQAAAGCQVRPETQVFEGMAASVLLKVATERQAELLVIGCLGRTGLKRLLLV